MKMLAVPLLVCAMMALTSAAAVPEANPGERTLQKRSSAKSCPSGWIAENGRCFLYFPTPMTWADAEKKCQFHGGNLASVHNFDEHYMIQSMILRKTHSYPLTWLGGSDAQQEGTWFWSDGTPFRFNYWSTGQPDNHANAHCLSMNYGDQKKFDDQPCSYRMPFVCAKPL
ncbi:type-2 ice-structuring protein-like [Micropterus salmoides]|uniref:type-2 ice-structuring protein-like n=1 Tax=Micropterus salmoides TaxID=27706 RepID=UPI0018ECD520|nr:type-2 ice-structuring protein-like [Micropterus salmoides]